MFTNILPFEVNQMRDYSLYEKAEIYDLKFPVRILRHHFINIEPAFFSHWHEQLELLLFTEGEAVVECNSKSISVRPGDLIIVNSNELHYGQVITPPLIYYSVIIDFSMIHSSFIDTCEMKYITPITQNLILFMNKVSNDNTVIEYINKIVSEYEAKDIGYEMAIKAGIYNLLVFLLRNYIEEVITIKDYSSRIKSLERFNNVFKYIEENYNEKLNVNLLAEITDFSGSHFLHLFRKITGKTLSEYINQIRINKAESLINNTNMNITEIAFSTGFNDLNYFSRVFYKYKKTSPSMIRKRNKKHLKKNDPRF